MDKLISRIDATLDSPFTTQTMCSALWRAREALTAGTLGEAKLSRLLRSLRLEARHSTGFYEPGNRPSAARIAAAEESRTLLQDTIGALRGFAPAHWID